VVADSAIEAFVIVEPNPASYLCEGCARNALKHFHSGRPHEFLRELIGEGLCTKHLLRWYERTQGADFVTHTRRALALRRYVVQLSTGAEMVA
jgi:hypothetical protein